MKHIKKTLAALLCLIMTLTCIPSVFADTVAKSTIDPERKGSLTIWEYDRTNVIKDGAWSDDLFTSTGWRESYVEDSLGSVTRHGDTDEITDLGNGSTSNGYAVRGVEFSILKVADIATFTESGNDGHMDYNSTMLLYGFDKVKTAELLKAIGLEGGAGRYTNADRSSKLNRANYYYTSDTINRALSNALTENETKLKDALEAFVKASSEKIVMDKTDSNGKTIQREMPVGLYLCVETAVPEMVTSTTAPFFLSVPMTTVSGNDKSESPRGGTQWKYDVVVYPKADTGIPTLEKTVREKNDDTGKNEGIDGITDGFNHNATGSSGDVMEYQIVSTLPTITSDATRLTTYQFCDSVCEGIAYNKSLSDVKLQIFRDKACSDKVTEWTQGDGNFAVNYSSDDRHMTVKVTEQGLQEINGRTKNGNGSLYMGYSNYTMRLTYTATIKPESSFILGDDGNCNEVVLTWKRTSEDYYDTLIDDCHVYSYGMNVTKLFSDIGTDVADDRGIYPNVKFKIRNKTDGYWVMATRNEADGIYYVDGHAPREADATVFYPVTVDTVPGKLVISGLEDDEYVLTEIETADGYTLLRDDIHVLIKAADDVTRPCAVYSKDVAGTLQNDPHFDIDGSMDLHLANIPQKHLAHNYLTASALVDDNTVSMLSDDGSKNAFAPFTVVNTRRFDLPKTGDTGVWMYCICGIVALAGGLLAVAVVLGKEKKDKEDNK